MGVSGTKVVDGNKLAAADLSGKYGYAVKLNSSAKIALCNTAGEASYGALDNKPVSGAAALVVTSGRTQVILAGTTVVGDFLTPDANGKWAVTTSPADAKGAVALAAGSANNLVEAAIISLGAQPSGARSAISIPIPALSALANSYKVLNDAVLGFAGRILGMDFFVTTAVTTAAKAATLTPSIGGVDVTGGIVALTSANCTPAGARVAGSAVTAANTFTATDVIDITASSVTAFVEGAGVVVLYFAPAA